MIPPLLNLRQISANFGEGLSPEKERPSENLSEGLFMNMKSIPYLNLLYWANDSQRLGDLIPSYLITQILGNKPYW